ncbi:MAG: hypothetical protein AAGG47_05925 [Pseudomonadota bacterium]
MFRLGRNEAIGVIPGLDPGIQKTEILSVSQEKLDCRIKAGNDSPEGPSQTTKLQRFPRRYRPKPKPLILAKAAPCRIG